MTEHKMELSSGKKLSYLSGTLMVILSPWTPVLNLKCAKLEQEEENILCEGHLSHRLWSKGYFLQLNF